ncbi:MAG: hypothetical protein GY765_03270 [bacterium]|nr:hypothetical protein [bacterium]
MIKVPRYREKDGKPIQPSSGWCKRARIKTKAAEKEGKKHKVTELYRDSRVKMALEELFYFKCAYCETTISVAAYWDVEHFRPKGRVAGRPDHPGYYWLAYKWTNLYPSCVFCNRNLKDQSLYDDPQGLPAKGKGDQFPLENEAHRAMGHEDDIAEEKPLLFDPCNDDPEKYLAYNEKGEILPYNGDRRALETISICHLGRRRLCNDRARVLHLVRKIVSGLQEAREANNQFAINTFTRLLESYKAPDAAYAGAVRAALRDPEYFFSNVSLPGTVNG